MITFFVFKNKDITRKFEQMQRGWFCREIEQGDVGTKNTIFLLVSIRGTFISEAFKWCVF